MPVGVRSKVRVISGLHVILASYLNSTGNGARAEDQRVAKHVNNTPANLLIEDGFIIQDKNSRFANTNVYIDIYSV